MLYYKRTYVLILKEEFVMINEPIIVKEAFQAIGVSITTTNEIEASTEGKIPELWNRYFQEQMMHHIPNQKRKKHSHSTPTMNQMKLVHIHLQSVRPFLH